MIRPATAADAPAIAALVQRVWGDHEIMGDPGRYRSDTLVAVDGVGVIGAGSCVPSERVAGLATVHVDVDPASRRHGIGTELFTALVGRSSATFLIGRALRSQPGAVPFVTALEFEPAESALEGWIDPTAVSEWIDATLSEPVAIRVLAPDELGAAGELLAAHMRRTHRWLPDAASTTEPEIFVAGAVAVLGLEDDGALSGAAALSRPSFGEQQGRAFLHWVTGPSDAAVASLLAGALQEAARRNLLVRVECNNHNAALWQALESIPGTQLEQDLTVWTKRV